MNIFEKIYDFLFGYHGKFAKHYKVKCPICLEDFYSLHCKHEMRRLCNGCTLMTEYYAHLDRLKQPTPPDILNKISKIRHDFVLKTGLFSESIFLTNQELHEVIEAIVFNGGIRFKTLDTIMGMKIKILPPGAPSLLQVENVMICYPQQDLISIIGVENV